MKLNPDQTLVSRAKHATSRFSVERVATVFSYPVNGMIRGVIDSRNLNLLFEEVRKHPVGKLQILAFGVIASRDINLIGNHDKKVFQCLWARQRSEMPSWNRKASRVWT
jgi:hypothetical protein